MRRTRAITLPSRQRGLVLIIMLALFTMAAAYMLVNSLNQGSNALALARAAKNRTALQDAKAALLTWAAIEAAKDATIRPGGLPCPDRNNDGIAESACTAANRLGRLPYKTLGIDPIYDASGELLWYGLSGNFRTTSTINSDTGGTITVTGQTPATNAVAVLLAPGMRLGTQNRGWTGASCSLTTDACNIASNYLEGINGDTTTTNYIAAAENITDSVTANLINDQLIVLTAAELMQTIEPLVAARIRRNIVAQFIYDSDPSLTDGSNQWSDDSTQRNKSRYFDAWGGFPFAAPFVSPPTSASSPNYTGQASPPRYEGLMPVVSNLAYTWTLGSGSVTKTGGAGTISATSCSATTSTLLRCSITWSGGILSFSMSGSAANVGRSFVQLPRLADLSTSGGSITARTISGSLTSAGAGIVSVSATTLASSGTITVNLTNSNLITSPVTSTSTLEFAGWFNLNQWYRQTYYAVSPGFAPGGAGSCTAGSTCLTVSKLAATPNDDKQAILILAGRSINGSARPSATLTNYLEGENSTTGDQVFEHGLGRQSGSGSIINDKVVVVAP